MVQTQRPGGGRRSGIQIALPTMPLIPKKKCRRLRLRVRFRNARNLVKNTRLRTITTYFDAIFRRILSMQQRNELLRQIEQGANALGVLWHIFFVYLAMLAEQGMDNANIFKQTFLPQLCTRFSDQELSSKTNPIQFPHLDLYLQRHPFPVYARKILRDFPKRPREAMCQENFICCARTCLRRLQDRAKSHIKFALKKNLWQF